MRNKIKIVFFLSLFMICLSNTNIYGYTGSGTENKPYVVEKEWELKEILTQKSKGNSWVYVAVNDGITIRNTITIESGKFRIYALGGNRIIKRTSNVNDSVNDKQDPKYCMRIMGETQVVFGYAANENTLILGGNKNTIAQSDKTSGWLNVYDNASITIGRRCRVVNVRNNESQETGAPIRVEGKITINGEIANCEGVNGGAVKVCAGEIVINETANIYSCVSETEGGAIHISKGSKMTMNGGQIHGCRSGQEGGGIFACDNSKLDVLAGQIYENISGESAGGVFAGYGATLIIGQISGTGPDIFNNKAAGSGGGVRCNGGKTENAGGTSYFYSGRIMKNYSGNNGGGISCGAPGTKGNSKIVLNNVSIYGNSSDGTAGGIWLPAKAKGITTEYVLINNCDINNNFSNQSTGGVMLHCKVNFINNRVENNRSNNSGGGIFIASDGSLTLYSGIIGGNNCGLDGDGIYVKGELKILSNARVETDNKVYLTKGTYIEVIGKLNIASGYVAIIDSEVKSKGTKVVKVGYSDSDAIKELYYAHSAEDEYTKDVEKKYICYGLNEDKCLRPGNYVSGYNGRWIIISKKYSIYFDKNCNDTVEGWPQTQIKFWNENIIISNQMPEREGYIVDVDKHWNVERDGSGSQIKADTVYSMNGNKTLYAIWKKKMQVRVEERGEIGGRIRFISLTYIDTIVNESKWFDRLKSQLMLSLKRERGQGIYMLNISYHKLINLKNNIIKNNYKISNVMNKELSKGW